MKDQLAAAGRGVDLFLQGPEANAPFLQLLDGLDEVLEGAAQPVQPPDNQGVVCTQMGECLSEARAVRDGSGDRVGVDVLAAGRCQGVLLEGEGLIKG